MNRGTSVATEALKPHKPNVLAFSVFDFFIITEFNVQRSVLTIVGFTVLTSARAVLTAFRPILFPFLHSFTTHSANSYAAALSVPAVCDSPPFVRSREGRCSVQ